MKTNPLALSLLMLLPLVPAWAGTTFYTDQTLFQAATTGRTDVLISDLVSGSNAIFEGHTFTYKGVTFTDTTSSLFVMGPAYQSGWFGALGTSVVNPNNWHNPWTVTLPGAYPAAGMPMALELEPLGPGGARVDPGPTTATISLSNGDSYVFSLQAAPGFIGFLSDTPVSWMHFQFTPDLDARRFISSGVSYGYSAVPEPSTAGLLALGAAFIGLRIRSRLNRAR